MAGIRAPHKLITSSVQECAKTKKLIHRRKTVALLEHIVVVTTELGLGF